MKRHGLSAAKQHGYRSAPTSGDGKFLRSTATMPDSKSDGGRVRVQVSQCIFVASPCMCKLLIMARGRQQE